MWHSNPPTRWNILLPLLTLTATALLIALTGCSVIRGEQDAEKVLLLTDSSRSVQHGDHYRSDGVFSAGYVSA